jgi:hypothetical protein
VQSLRDIDVYSKASHTPVLGAPIEAPKNDDLANPADKFKKGIVNHMEITIP